MPRILPISGEVNGYKYICISQSAVNTEFQLQAPDGTCVQVTCYTKQEMDLLTTYPDVFWNRYIAKQS